MMNIFRGFQKGINLGGWLSQFERYDVRHFESFITREDIGKIASLGFDHVRVPVDYILLEDEDGNRREFGYRCLRSCREWCEELGLNMLIDLHECYGYSFDPLKKDMDRKRFFYDEALQRRFLDLWRQIAVCFRDYPEQVAFEPLNEVVLPEVADAWNKVASRYIREMRSVVPDSWLVIGGIRYSHVSSIPLLSLPPDDRIVYNFHCYDPLIFTHQGAYWVDRMPPDFRIGYPKSLAEYRQAGSFLDRNLTGSVDQEGIPETGPAFFEALFAPAAEKALRDNRPLYCGEYGVIDLADNQDKLRWLKDIHTAMDRMGIGRALWNYKEKDFGLQDERFSEIRDQFVKIL